MPNKKIADLKKELEYAHEQIREVELSIGDTISSREIAQNVIKVTVEQMHEGVQIIDHDLRYVYLNDAATRHGGTNTRWDLLGKKMVECFPQLEGSEFLKRLKRVLKTGEHDHFENHFRRTDGTESWYDLYLEPHSIGALIRSIDITDKKKLQEEYFHAQKMESIGRLAGGIAHDFNNKLGILTLYCEMAANKLDTEPEKVRGYLQKMQGAIQQATVLTRQLLAFSRKQVLDPKVLNLNSLLEASQIPLAKLLGEHIELQFNLAPDLGNIKVDASQIDQVVLNLCINARDAIEGQGKIIIETKNVVLDHASCNKHSDLKPGRYVLLSVSDTGCGMTEEVRKRVFEPFFTTKEAGRGTGLGLPMVHGIVRQSEGHIWLYSEPGIGTTFKIYFPQAQEELENIQDDSDSHLDVNGTETILLVEDDPALREAFAHTLQTAGYKVYLADSGESAREVFAKHKNEIVMLLTDIVLPKSNGTEIANEFLKVKSDLKIAYMSGYTENSIVHHGVLDQEAVLIQKPVSTKTLLRAVRQVLDGVLTQGVV